MKHPAVREVFAYWNELRGERAAPERNEIDPSAIRDVLADTFMLEVDRDRRFPFRLVGTRVNGLFASEQKGRSFLDLWRAEERHNIAAILLTVADGACPVAAGGVGVPIGKDEWAVELLFLPLRHHGRTHARILGVVKLAKTPSWLGLLPLGPISLRTLRIIDAEESLGESPMRRVAIGQSPTDLGEGRAPSGKPCLRLIEGGRVD